MNLTSIEWTDFSSNPVIYRDREGRVVWACVKKSAGCKNCYAESIANHYRRGGPFNAAVMATLTPELNENELWKMLTARRVGGKDVDGGRCFPGDMTDLFGEWVPDELLDVLMVVFAYRRRVTWQVLTKRSDRARDYFGVMASDSEEYRRRWDVARARVRQLFIDRGRRASMGPAEYIGMMMAHQRWPLPNVHLGVSVENQETADERVPILLQTPAAIRWVSYEPALGQVNFAAFGPHEYVPVNGAHGDDCATCGTFTTIRHSNLAARLDWIVVGGESGPGARPLDIAWARQTVQQCKAAGVPVFVKQLGSRPYDGSAQSCDASTCCIHDYARIRLRDRKGGDMAEWPEDLRVRELPEVRA